MSKKKKIILIPSIVIASIVILIAVFGVIDFNRVMNGKSIIFPLHAYVYAIEYSDDNGEILDGAYNFDGIGYSITGCNKDDFNFHFGNVDNQNIQNKCIQYDVEMAGDDSIIADKLIGVDRCLTTYSTNPNEADKCILGTIVVTFKDGKADHVKIIHTYANEKDAKEQYDYEHASWSNATIDPKLEIDGNKLIRRAYINEYPGYMSELAGLTKEQAKELLEKVGYEIN